MIFCILNYFTNMFKKISKKQQILRAKENESTRNIQEYVCVTTSLIKTLNVTEMLIAKRLKMGFVLQRKYEKSYMTTKPFSAHFRI